jgi:hypothetical protein
MATRVGLDSLLDRQFGIEQENSQQASWRETFLAVLPFILAALIMSVPQLIVVTGWGSWEGGYVQIGQNILGIFILLLSLGLLVYAWRTDWPRWMGTWTFLFALVLIIPLGYLSTLFEDDSRLADVFSEFAGSFLLPLLIASLLYLVVRHNPIKALLAVIPIVLVVWQLNMEMVPDQIEAPITMASLFLAGLTTAALMRWVSWRTGLWLVVLLSAVSGLLYAYAGIYHGGMLPYIAPGPSLLEVVKSFTPQFLAVSTIIMGPFLAASFRSIGRNSGARGNLSYHLVLLGMLLVLAGSLANFFVIWDNRMFIYQQSLEVWFTWAFILGLLCYISGVILLGQAGMSRYNFPGWLDYILLVILTVTLPVVLFMLVTDLYSHNTDPLFLFGRLYSQSAVLLNSIGMAWLFLAVWLVTHRRQGTGEVGQVVENLIA